MKKIFIDGKAGTTGLRIYERLEGRGDISLLTLPEEERKNPESRKRMLNEADIVFLCLPDEASIEAVSMIENPNTVVIDTSTAHRTNPDWCYAFPEIFENGKEALKASKRIANPGCHASGFIALVKPLIDNGIISKDIKLTCHSITGYSGGGKRMISEYECGTPSPLFAAPRQYGLTQNHKHLKEMKAVCSLENDPIFCPIVSNFYSGMEVTVPLFASDLCEGKSIKDIKDVYRKQFTGPIVSYTEKDDGDGMLSAVSLGGLDTMEVSVFGNNERIILVARYDNLGKGASGSAVEALNVILDTDPELGLEI